ncbi:hypothetical protein BpHYR1_003031 [Brachionus plicatilis]|uniref:Uncharacterized protein n=1 Tax=Brachionus plicatilis TaxID=10195 RepID=A0A3M7QZH5_BRAPC|nr:hypothetical protein BpHYR1_003031 [Brachionus plicatilis]
MDASSVQSGARTLSPAYQPPASSNYTQEELNFHSPYLQTNTNLKPDLFLSPNSNLSNPQNSNGGSLPDLTAFQFQNNQFHQNLQLHDYSQRQKNNYDNQLLQPNIQQHSHIGPVKPTHLGSVSPTRGTVRYSPTNSNINRRPSPQRSLPPGINTQSKSSLSAHSTPTSPLHSNQAMPILEFPINSSKMNNYSKNMMNNGVYRNAPGNIGQNGGESLPPSPQSQQSCFNSPQGSPDPLAISPQDMNPFTSSNNYEIIQQKFDGIKLDSSNNQFNFGQFLMNNSNQMVKKNRSENIDDSMDSDIGAKNQSLINSRNESLSSIGSSSNQANNLSLFNDIENYQQNTSFKNNILNKNHKNSIPNIILTYPAEEKGEMVISQELSSDLNFDVANLLDFSNFTGPVSIDDVNSINFNESI